MNYPFAVQWHITPKCSCNCEHCYVTDKRTSKHETPLDYEEMKKCMDNVAGFCEKYHLDKWINWTGGDPLERPDFIDLLKYADSSGFRSSVLGTPYITDNQVKEIKPYLQTYQISLDGLPKTHDTFRRKIGAYDDALRTLTKLRQNGITSAIMTTISKVNAKEIPALYAQINGKADIASFARLVPVGSGSSLKDELMSPQSYRAFLKQMEPYCLDKHETRFTQKDHLWVPHLVEAGILEKPKGEKVTGGCGMGWRHLTILPDGATMPCRRIPLTDGNVSEQSLEDIWFDSELFNQVRDIDAIEGCGECDLKNACRGCRAVAYGLSEDLFAKDPQCFYSE